MIAEQIRRQVTIELTQCVSSKDVLRTFAEADSDFLGKRVPIYRRQEVLQEIKSNLDILLPKTENVQLVREGRLMIDSLLSKYKLTDS